MKLGGKCWWFHRERTESTNITRQVQHPSSHHTASKALTIVWIPIPRRPYSQHKNYSTKSYTDTGQAKLACSGENCNLAFLASHKASPLHKPAQQRVNSTETACRACNRSHERTTLLPRSSYDTWSDNDNTPSEIPRRGYYRRRIERTAENKGSESSKRHAWKPEPLSTTSSEMTSKWSKLASKLGVPSLQHFFRRNPKTARKKHRHKRTVLITRELTTMGATVLYFTATTKKRIEHPSGKGDIKDDEQKVKSRIQQIKIN